MYMEYEQYPILLIVLTNMHENILFKTTTMSFVIKKVTNKIPKEMYTNENPIVFTKKE